MSLVFLALARVAPVVLAERLIIALMDGVGADCTHMGTVAVEGRRIVQRIPCRDGLEVPRWRAGHAVLRSVAVQQAVAGEYALKHGEDVCRLSAGPLLQGMFVPGNGLHERVRGICGDDHKNLGL